MFEKYDCLKDENLSKFSTMKVGGKAKYIVFPENRKELLEIFEIIKENNLKYFILGNGSNVLFDDKGFDGVVISLKKFDFFRKKCNFVCVGAGINLFLLNQKLAKAGLSGLEWSYGIPATLGGLVVMNGGSFGQEIGQFVQSVTVFDGKRIKVLKKNQIEFSYRHSNLSKYVVLSVLMKFVPEKKEIIQAKMNECFAKKKSSQPCELPSLGSVFKLIHTENEIIYPAKLIDNLGLKGVKIGGAEISTKHAGFIVNSGNATSEDILKLVEFVEKKLAEIGVFPEREMIILK